MSSRVPTDRLRIELFLRRLGERFRRPGRVYLVGGTTMVFEGLRAQSLLKIGTRVNEQQVAGHARGLRLVSFPPICVGGSIPDASSNRGDAESAEEET